MVDVVSHRDHTGRGSVVTKRASAYLCIDIVKKISVDIFLKSSILLKYVSEAEPMSLTL